MALIWNYAYNTWTVREIPSISAVATQRIFLNPPETWADVTGSWAEKINTWGAADNLKSFRGTIAFSDVFTQTVFSLDDRYFLGSVGAHSFLERTGIDIAANADGAYVHVPERVRLLIEIMPLIEAEPNKTFQWSIGTQERYSDPVAWIKTGTWNINGPVPHFDVGVSGRLLAFRLEETGSTPWRLTGYKMDVAGLGYL